MRKTVLALSFLLVILYSRLCAQDGDTKIYIERGKTFTYVFAISKKAIPFQDMITAHSFYEMGDKIPWGKSEMLVSFIYAGIDNQHNLHVICEDREGKRRTLIFALDTSNAGELVFAPFKGFNLWPITLRVKIVNNLMLIDYLGNLTLYKE
jgi:hypothetical protein